MPELTIFNDIGTTPVAATQPRPSYPIPSDPTAIIYSQDFTVPFTNYAAPTISSAHPDIATAFCIGDSELQDLGGGIARYTRQWATIPANRNEWGTFAFTFPGLKGTAEPPYNQYWNVDVGGGRDPRTESVKSRIYHEYFLCAAGQTYTSPDEIPTIEPFRVKLASNPDAVMPYALPSGVYLEDTTPTKEEYEASIAAEDELVAESSKPERWQGEIYVRMTHYVKAQ